MDHPRDVGLDESEQAGRPGAHSLLARALIHAALALLLVGGMPPSAPADEPGDFDERLADEDVAPSLPLDDSRAGLEASVGIFTGGRLSVFPGPPGRVRVALEGRLGFYMLSPAYGGGARIQVEAVRSTRSALLLSPGAELWYSPPDGDAFLGHRNAYRMLVANANVSWLHRFDGGLETDVGLRGGVIREQDLEDGSIFTFPDFALFLGLRF